MRWICICTWIFYTSDIPWIVYHFSISLQFYYLFYIPIFFSCFLFSLWINESAVICAVRYNSAYRYLWNEFWNICSHTFIASLMSSIIWHIAFYGTDESSLITIYILLQNLICCIDFIAVIFALYSAVAL